MWNKPWNNVKPIAKQLNQLKTFSLYFQIELFKKLAQKTQKNSLKNKSFQNQLQPLRFKKKNKKTTTTTTTTTIQPKILFQRIEKLIKGKPRGREDNFNNLTEYWSIEEGRQDLR